MPHLFLFWLVFLTAALHGVAAYAGFIQYTATAGWTFAKRNPLGGLDEGFFSGGGDKPATVQSYDFSFRGAFCPQVGGDDYLCANVLSSAELNGRRLTLRSRARLVRHKATSGKGAIDATYADTRIEICGVTGSVPTPVATAYFYIGLAGTASQSQSDPSLVVQATGVASFQFVPIQCVANSQCPPLKVPNFSGSTCLSLGLRTDARVTNPDGVGPFDIEAIADFSDTMELLAIEGRDENDQPIPGLEFTITDANGTPIVTLPNTPPPPDTSTTTTTEPGPDDTTTTYPIATTTSAPAGGATTTSVPGTTTTSMPSGGATTTSVPGGGVTTTTLPAGCRVGASYASVKCRLDELTATVLTNGGAVAPRLSAKLAAALAAVERAEQSVGQRGGKTSKRSLRKALRALGAYRKLLGSKKAHRTLNDGALDELGARVPGLQADLKTLVTSGTR